ncbi:MAG: polymer-forming cytoskeletal protein [Candidatus Margulisbacteria bacterium]|jgi:cytoskeletal protein CcmA (bactofilin family)|nr:polymer-forming cytoskeletal protein [Candidatus Margulisiibacteriota bacterium]
MGMFSTAKKSSVPGGAIDSIIGENARLQGELTTKGSINVAGEFEGTVRAEGEVVIASSGKVVGELHGHTVSVSGRVDGNIYAKETLEICKSGRVHGDLAGGRIIIEEGAVYHGRVKVESGPTADEPLPQA